MSSIRIIATPPGPALLWCREDWVGITIPLATAEELEKNPPRGFRIGSANMGGYIVCREKAVAALQKAEKIEAARFWACIPTSYLQFKKEVCELVE